MKKILFVLCLTALIAACARQGSESTPTLPGVLTAQGTEKGNGADYLPYDSDSAWFVGAGNKIKYCYQVQPGFERSSSDLEKAIDGAFATWSKYMSSKKINRLTTQRALNPKCDGTEDLTFYFGIRNTEVNNYVSKYSNPVAFSQRTAYDKNLGWGRGFVWLTSAGSIQPDGGLMDQEKEFPDWSVEMNVEGILLHELGHVYGCEHVDGTIMSENIAQDIRYSPLMANGNFQDYWADRRKKMSHIDGYLELAICPECDSTYHGTMGLYTEVTNSTGTTVEENISTNFELLVGHKAKSSPTSVIGTLTGNQKDGYILTVKDGSDEFTFPLDQIDPSSISYHPGKSIFKTVLSASQGAGESVIQESNFGSTSPASLTTISGEKLNLWIERNMGSLGQNSGIGTLMMGPFNIKFTRNGTTQYLFLGH